MLSKINTINQINNLYSGKRFKQPAFGHTVHLEHHLMINDKPFKNVVRKLELLIGKSAQHSLIEGRHVVEIEIPGADCAKSVLAGVTEIEKKAYGIQLRYLPSNFS